MWVWWLRFLLFLVFLHGRLENVTSCVVRQTLGWISSCEVIRECVWGHGFRIRAGFKVHFSTVSLGASQALSSSSNNLIEKLLRQSCFNWLFSLPPSHSPFSFGFSLVLSSRAISFCVLAHSLPFLTLFCLLLLLRDFRQFGDVGEHSPLFWQGFRGGAHGCLSCSLLRALLR